MARDIAAGSMPAGCGPSQVIRAIAGMSTNPASRIEDGVGEGDTTPLGRKIPSLRPDRVPTNASGRGEVVMASSLVAARQPVVTRWRVTPYRA